MKREDIAYFNSWKKCFKNCSPAKVMEAIINGIWIASNEDPEDIYKVYPKLIVLARSGSVEADKEFGLCPFEFSFEDGETWRWDEEEKKKNPKYEGTHRKGRDIERFGENWHLDKYEMRKAVTANGLYLAKEYKITKEEIVALHKKHGWDDNAMYEEFKELRKDLWESFKFEKDFKYFQVSDLAFKEIRAAFCPHFNTIYNWMDYPEKAGFPEIPNIDNRSYEWEQDE